MWPLPVGPVCTTRPAKQSMTGRARATSASAPPTITSSVPSSASFGVRDSGASISVMPRSLICAASRIVEDGSEVEQSMIISFLPADGQAVGTGDERLDFRAAGDADHDDVAASASAAQVLRLAGAARHQVVDRRAVAMADDGQGKTLLDDILGHAVTHQAEPDEADLFLAHVCRPGCGVSRRTIGRLRRAVTPSSPGSWPPACDAGSPLRP